MEEANEETIANWKERGEKLVAQAEAKAKSHAGPIMGPSAMLTTRKGGLPTQIDLGHEGKRVGLLPKNQPMHPFQGPADFSEIKNNTAGFS